MQKKMNGTEDPHQWLTLEITYDCMFASGGLHALHVKKVCQVMWNLHNLHLDLHTLPGTLGLTKETMNGLDCGIYVGCATLGGIEPDIPAFGPFTNIGRGAEEMSWDALKGSEVICMKVSWGYAYSGLSGRVSHTLSLRGPCFTVDTACSATVRPSIHQSCAAMAWFWHLNHCRWVAFGTNLQWFLNLRKGSKKALD